MKFIFNNTVSLAFFRLFVFFLFTGLINAVRALLFTGLINAVRAFGGLFGHAIC